MGQPVDFVGTNVSFGPSPGTEGYVGSLRAFDNGTAIVEAWEFSPEEMAEIQRTGRVYMSILSRSLAPIFVGSEAMVREVVADLGGVWARETTEDTRPIETKANK